MKQLNSKQLARIITMSSVLTLWLTVSPVTAFFWTLFLVWAVFKLDSQIIGYGAVALLVLIPIALSTDLYEWMAEQLAVYVFYLLCITVALQIIELVRDGDMEKESKDSDQKREKSKVSAAKQNAPLPDHSK